MLTFLIAAAVGGGTYLYAKSKQASTGTAAVAGAATGAGTAAAVSIVGAVLGTVLPVLIPIAIIGIPAYYIGKSSSRDRKALGPGRDSF